MAEFKPCPFCGGTNITMSAGGICSECEITCDDCGATVIKDVPWGEMNEEQHDKECVKILADEP